MTILPRQPGQQAKEPTDQPPDPPTRDLSDPAIAYRKRMHYLERMAFHIEAAEMWSSNVAALEAEAEREAARQNQQVGGRALSIEFVTDRLLDRPDYRRAVAIRNSHQTRAQMYAAAAQALAPEAQR